MFVGDYTFEYSDFKVKLATIATNTGLLNWYARKREPNTLNLWQLRESWEMNTPDGALVVMDEANV